MGPSSASALTFEQTLPLGPPYPPTTAPIGGLPTVGLDVAICSVFIFLFILGAVGHMVVLQVNHRKGHNFPLSGLMFGFCMARTTTCILRIAWAFLPTNVRLGIAAMVFVNAGVLLLFIINLIFAQRVLRAVHPHFGWHKAIHLAFRVLYIMLLLSLAMIITVTVQSFYTLNKNTHRIDRDIQLFTSSYLLFISFLPIPLVMGGIIVPPKTRLDKFGAGRWMTKVMILLGAAFLLCVGAAFRTGTLAKPPRPATQPAWYHAKWCFYVFNFTIEFSVVFLYLVLRVDRRFHVPDGSKNPGDYAKDRQTAALKEKPQSLRTEDRILSEEEDFDGRTPEASEHVKNIESGEQPGV